MEINIAPVHHHLSEAAQDVHALAQVWQTVDAQSCPDNYNFHMHTVCSDGKLTPAAIMTQALAIGLRGLAITDHHNIQGYQEAAQWLAQQDRQQTLPHLWTGVEITSQLDGVKVHILGYGFDPQHTAIATYLRGKAPQGQAAQANVVIKAIHQAGGLVVLAHPARYRRPYQHLLPQAASLGVDGAETYYDYRRERPWQPTAKFLPGVKALVNRLGLFHTCGTDTHGLDLRLRL